MDADDETPPSGRIHDLQVHGGPGAHTPSPDERVTPGDAGRRVPAADAGSGATGCGSRGLSDTAATDRARSAGTLHRERYARALPGIVVSLLVGRVGLGEVLLVLGFALVPIVIALAVALWARLTGDDGAQA